MGMIYPENFEQKIDFNKIRLQLKSNCISAMGIENVEAMRFSTDISSISRSIDLIDEFETLSQEGIPFIVLACRTQRHPRGCTRLQRPAKRVQAHRDRGDMHKP